jgi:hypothetical protein
LERRGAERGAYVHALKTMDKVAPEHQEGGGSILQEGGGSILLVLIAELSHERLVVLPQR